MLYLLVCVNTTFRFIFENLGLDFSSSSIVLVFQFETDDLKLWWTLNCFPTREYVLALVRLRRCPTVVALGVP